MKGDIPSSKLKRSGVVALAATKVGARQLAHFSKRPFLSQTQHAQDKNETDEINAEIVFKALVQLRGTALKVAQMLGMESDLLPENYRKELAKSYYQVPPLNRSLIRKVMLQELGDAPENLFASFESQAFAAASLGQVHLATSQTGEKLAIKVQYPGIESTIQSDIQLVKQLTRPMKEHKDIVVVLEEIEARMVEETNYILEAESAGWFAKHLQMPRVAIPQVYPKQSSKHVLCMQYLEGKHLKQWLELNPSQQERDRAAQTIYDIYTRSVFELNRFHADPNVGNYLFLEGGSIGLIDFGCVKQLSPKFASQYSQLCQAVVKGNFDEICDVYRNIGVLKVQSGDISDEFYKTILAPFFEWYAKPCQQEYFNFGEHQGFTTEGLRLAENMRNQQCSEKEHVEMNRDFVYTDRTLYGLYKMFEIMGAKVCMQNQWTCG